METVESLIPPRDTGDSDQEWEKPDDEVALARATLAHNVHAHEDESANSALASFTTLEVDDTSMDLRLQEMEAAMKRLLAKGSEMVAVKEDTTMDTTGSEVPTTGDFVPEGAATDDPMDKPAVPTTGDFVPEGAAADDPMDRPEVPTTGDFVPEGGDTVAKDDANKPRPYSALPAGTLEEKVFKIEGFPDNFPGIGKKSADWAQQLTKEEIASLFSELKAEQWSRPAVERVLEVYQIYKRQLAQEKMLAAPYNRARRGVGHSSMGQLDPGSTGATLMCPNCFSDWQRQDNKVEGKCKLCQKLVIAVDKGPPSAEIKLGQSSWRMFCGPQGVTWHTDADEAQKEAASVDIGSWAQPPPRPTDQKELSFADQEAGDRPHLRGDWQPSQETRAFHPQLAAAMDIIKKSSGPVDKQPKKPTEEEFLDHINPQLDVIVEMQAGAQSVEEAKGASILRQLDTEKLRSLLKRNYLQGPGNQGDEFFAAQTSLEEAKASNKRMQDEGSQRSQLLRPVADSIDAWGTQLRAALEMNVFNPECPLKDMELDDIEALKERYLNTKFLLNQSRNPFPASLLQELPTLAALQREGERVARDSGEGLSSTGAFGPEEQSPEAVLGVPVGSVEFQMLRLKRIIELHMGEQRMIGGRWKQHPGQPFFEPIALTMEEIEAQVSMGTRPPLDKIIRPFHAEGDGNTHWRKEVQTWDLVSLFSCFGHTYSARHLYAVWSHLPITVRSHKRGAKNKQQNLQRREDHRDLMKEAKEFVILHDLPVPTTNQEWKQLSLITLPLKAFRHFPEIYNMLSNSLGQESVVEVKMAWRCNTVQWWTARLKPEYAGPIYRKLGYSESHIKGLGLGDRDSSAAFGAERIPLDPASEQERALPPITPDNVTSVASDDYKKKNAGDKTAHVFWAKMECGLVLSSVSPWEIVDKKKGETRGGYVCRHCKGFWRSGRGASRFLLITGEHKGKSAQLQLILDEPPQHLYESWVKDRIEFYKRVEPTAAPRDRSLRVNPSLSSRLRFSKTNLMGQVSDMIWSVVLSNPERDGLKKIHELAASRVRPA
ncbi:ppsC [Symbiodinium sp. CCMP2592]|nr:ppsC [Symbiodinium sp. CCMP2592]